MRKRILFSLYCSIGLLPICHATQLTAVKPASDPTGIEFKQLIQNKDQQESIAYTANEAITFEYQIQVRQQDIAKNAGLFAVAVHNDQWYQLDSSGLWKPWNTEPSSLAAFQTKLLEKTEQISLLNSATIPEGEYLVYIGYQPEQGDLLFYNDQPAAMVVFNESSPALHPVKNQHLLKNYFTSSSASVSRYPAQFADFSPPIAANAAGEASSSVSQTNLQEIGVDEADRIKTDGQNLFVIEQCQEKTDLQCISSYTITETPAENKLAGQFNTKNSQWQQANLYLTDIQNTQHLVYLTDSMTYPIFDIWYYPGSWLNNETQINLIDVSKPDNLQSKKSIRIDASTLSSRMINNVLYLVTRKTAYSNYFIDPIPLDNLAASASAPFPTDQPPITAKEVKLDDLLPGISFGEETEATPLVKASDCYMPNQDSHKPIDNTVITITAIPLENPEAHYSTCIAGQVDTFYMSTSSLYLATSRYPISLENNSIIYPEDLEMNTEIHKFTLGSGKLEYKGSGTVPGHLGWEMDKQPFRMGEYDGILKVATSKGNTWTGNSTTRVGILREMDNPQRLEEISHLDNLGKPNERLYAARFIQNRGYLVTFRNTDPLYVLNFKDPENPQIVGELEINGYSDYLHPIGENLLLGIGKDAIPNENAERGALPQGVKLSLFDVSDGTQLREIDSLVMGKRGSDSTVSYDHHALAWLQQDESATLAIPIQINDRQIPNSGYDYTQPRAYYEWTETGLFTFNIQTDDDPSITLQGKLITDSAEGNCPADQVFCYLEGQNTQNDRAVIQGDSVHYIHNNAVHSSAISDLN